MNSTTSNSINDLYLLTLLGSIVVGCLVIGLILYFANKYRSGKGTPRKTVKNQFKYEITWTVFAFSLVIILFLASTPILLNIRSPANANDAEVINIRGSRFHWSELYDNGTLKVSDLETSGGLNLKVGQSYMLNLTSSDVIHSFFVYDLSFKLDAVPGSVNHFYFTINEPGDYVVTCAEFCGAGHYAMHFTIHATV